MEFIKLAGVGLTLGITTVIPGLSTATIAVVFNVFYRLIDIITPDVKKILTVWKFWLPLVIGGVSGIFFFSKVITFLFKNHFVSTNWFFIGIIVGSLPIIYQRARRPGSAFPAASSTISAVLALAMMVVMAVLKPSGEAVFYTTLTPPLFLVLVGAGALAAVAMIIPGISGSFLLLVIGFYHTIVQAVSELNITLLAPVGLGAVAGILAGAAFVRFLLRKAPGETNGAVLGLVAGSVPVLFPGGFGSGAEILLSVLSLLVGAGLSFLLGRHDKDNMPGRQS